MRVVMGNFGGSPELARNCEVSFAINVITRWW